jgi:subtilisin family serine protease
MPRFSSRTPSYVPRLAAAFGALALVCAGAVAASAGSAAAGSGVATLRSKAQSPASVPGELIVRFEPGTSRVSRASVLSDENATVEEPLLLPGAFRVSVAKDVSVERAAHAFEQHPDVLYAEPNRIYRASTTVPNDPLFPKLWGLSQSTDKDIDAPEAWDLTKGDRAVKVAVVDTGIAYDHPDLAPNIVGPTFDFAANDTDARDENGHGTHVAGTIGARGNDATGVSGVNWNVGLMPVRVLDATGGGTTASVTNGFVFAAAGGARVVNASLGGSGFSQAMKDAVDAAASTTLFVVAAGNAASDNDFAPQYPCNFASPNLVCVAATDQSDALAEFSNFGKASVDLAAPGVDILSTWPAYENLFTETFEDDLSGWLPGGVPNTWARTGEQKASGNFSATDSPGGLYPDRADNWLETADPVSFAGRAGCQVHYALRLETGIQLDELLVESSTDGAEWTERDVLAGTTAGEFFPIETDLSELNGQPNVLVRFRLTSDPINDPADGAHIDDVAIRCLSTSYEPSDYNTISGTSMATPHATGAAALLFAMKPAATVAEVRAALLGSVDVLPNLAGQVATSGRLNAANAVQMISAEPPPAPPPGPPAPPPPPPPPGPQPPAAASCLVANVKGKTVARARSLLRARRCVLGRVTRTYSGRVGPGKIMAQSRRPGARLPRGARVNVVVSRGRRR